MKLVTDLSVIFNKQHVWGKDGRTNFSLRVKGQAVHLTVRSSRPWWWCNYYYYRYSALGPVWAETRVQSGDWYGSGTLHPGQVLRGSLPLLSPDDAICNLKFNVTTSLFNVPSQVDNADTTFLCQGANLAVCSHYVVTILPVLLSTSKMNVAISTVCPVYQL